jgi:hypothetical protein
MDRDSLRRELAAVGFALVGGAAMRARHAIDCAPHAAASQ